MAWQGKKSRSPFGIIAAIAVNAALVAVLLTALVVRNGEDTTPGTIDVDVKDPDESKVEEKEKPIPLPQADEPTANPDEPDEPTVIVGEPSPELPQGSKIVYPRPGANAGQPDYPPTERRLGHAGNVVLALCVDAQGKVTSASVKVSSGYPQLDRAALDWAKGIAWRPGLIEGRPSAMCFDQPYRFVIRDE